MEMFLEMGQGLQRVLYKLMDHAPAAQAIVTGSDAYPNVKGVVSFYPVSNGVTLSAEFEGLPTDGICPGPGQVFGFHIHEGGSCTGTAEMPFADAGGHYNPSKAPHPCHAGDMPPLFGWDGRAWLAFFDGRVRVQELLGKTVIVHRNPDDFTTQPSGNAGPMIACGVIRPA